MYKFRAISGSAWKMHSLTPPKSSKVKLRVRASWIVASTKSQSSYFFSLVAFAMGWDAHPLPQLICAREIGKIGQGQAYLRSSL